MGTRLGIGFGVLLLGLGLFTAIVLSLENQSARAQRAFSEDIAPLRDRALQLEHDLLHVAIGMRDFALLPEHASRAELATRIEGARTTLGQLEALAKSPLDADRPARFGPDARTYLAQATALLTTDLTGEARLARARDLGQLRASVLGELEHYLAGLQRDADAALATMATARERVATGSLAMVALAALFTLAIAWLTTRAVRHPLRTLTRVAASLGRGDWTDALRLTAHELPPHGEADVVHSETRALTRAVATAALQIESRERRLRARAAVSAAISSTADIGLLASRALLPIVDQVHAEVGIVYQPVGETPRLRALATSPAEGNPSILVQDEGTPREAARTRRTIVTRNQLRDNETGPVPRCGQVGTKAIVAVPILAQDTLCGVLLVARSQDFDESAVTFLENVARELGTGMQNAVAQAHTWHLLEEITERNGRIEAQNETLRRQGEELRTQAVALATADEHKNRFLAMLAHELRNPMVPIAIHLEILRRVATDSAPARQAQSVITRQTRQLTRLIDDLLDLSRGSQDKLRVERDPLDLVQVARACVEDQAPVLTGRSIRFEVDLPGAPLAVNGDRARLTQVIDNLVANAVKFTPPGGCIRLWLHADRSRNHAVLHVIDTGEGLDAELIPQIFEPFRQGPASLHRADAGLGLGLALVKMLVTLHGGTVEARSEGPGRGSEFIVRLPLGAEDVPMPAPGPVLTPPEAADRRRWRVLIVDDYIDAAKGLQTLLELDDHVVEVAHDGAEALAKARDFRPHLVFCDINLPLVDGFKVARQLRAEEDFGSLFLVALTGFGSEEDAARCLAAGFDRHIVKPIDPERLTEIFQSLERRMA